MLFGSLSHIGDSLMCSASPKIIQKSALFRSQNFVAKYFSVGEAQNAANTIRIGEYFNEATAENTCSKIRFKSHCFG